MYYVQMTAEEAMKLRGKNVKVLVAICDEDTPVSDFSKRRFEDCEDIIRSGKRIQHEIDEFIDQIRVMGTVPVKPHKRTALILLPPED